MGNNRERLGGLECDLAYPSGCWSGSGAFNDLCQFVVAESKLHRVVAGGPGAGSAASFRFAHDDNFIVNQKTLATPDLVVYDKAMNTQPANLLPDDYYAKFCACGFNPAHHGSHTAKCVTETRAAVDEAWRESTWVCHFTYTWHEGSPEQRKYARTGSHVDVEWVTSEYSPEGHYSRCSRCGVQPQ